MTAGVAVIVGCGNIGSRHLQSLLVSRYVQSIHVVEPIEAARALAQQRAAEVGGHDKALTFGVDFDAMPDHVDVVVIATAAAERRTAFEAVLGRAHIANVVFEKFLFPRLADYAAVAQALEREGIAAWVNCPRRVWPSYQVVREAFHGHDQVTLRLTGSAWGLASNAVHAFDTFDFVTGNEVEAVLTERLDPLSGESKRSGYSEVFGTLVGEAGHSCRAELTCYRDGGLERLTEYVSPQTRVLIDEKRGRALWSRAGEDWQIEAFPPLNVSELAFVFDELLIRGGCGLPQFAVSARLHQLVLRAFGRHLGCDVEGGEGCLIT